MEKLAAYLTDNAVDDLEEIWMDIFNYFGGKLLENNVDNFVNTLAEHLESNFVETLVEAKFIEKMRQIWQRNC